MTLAAAGEVDHGDNFPRIEPAKDRRGPTKADIDVVRRISRDLELWRDVPELERHSEASLDDVLTGDGQPEQRRQRDGEHFEAEVPERMIGHEG